jgi:chromosome partitioning protein
VRKSDVRTAEGAKLVFVCACVSQKGGAGKTTLVLHLAVAAHLAGYEAVIIDLDPQGTVEAWGGWRKDAPPVVISAKSGNLSKTLERARDAGADVAFIDTPPLAQADASVAARAADLVLIPCRPRAFDLHAIRLTASLVEMTKKTAFAVFNGGHPSTTSGYDEPAEIVTALGLKVAPIRIADRGPYHQATMTGQAAQEIEPDGRAAREVKEMWEWLCQQTGMPTQKHTTTKAGKRG